MTSVTISESAYAAGEAAIAGYPIPRDDLFDVAGDAINAAVPVVLFDVLAGIVDELRAREESLRGQGFRIRAAGLGEAALLVLDHVEGLRVGRPVVRAPHIREAALKHLPSGGFTPALDPGSAAAAGQAYTQRDRGASK